MLEFKKLLKEFYKNDSEILLLKKNDSGINNYTINELSKSEDDGKEIHSNMIIENTKLFLEFKDENFTSSAFTKFFDERCGNLIVRFNFPLQVTDKKIKITINSYRFENEIEVKKTKTLGEVKQRIAEVLNISEQEFVLKKNSHHGAELKNLSDPIEKYTTNAINLYIEFGCPQKENEIKINLFSCEYDLTFFLVFPYKLTDLGFFVIDLGWTFKELKEKIIIELEKKGVKYDKDITILREYLTERPAKIYSESGLLRDFNFTENKKVIIQEYNYSLLKFTTTDIQLTVREWDSSKWRVSKPFEIHFKKGTTLLELAFKLAELFPEIKPENMSAYKMVNGFNVYMDDFKKYKVSLYLNL
jgi:hypothetical protein